MATVRTPVHRGNCAHASWPARGKPEVTVAYNAYSGGSLSHRDGMCFAVTSDSKRSILVGQSSLLIVVTTSADASVGVCLSKFPAGISLLMAFGLACLFVPALHSLKSSKLRSPVATNGKQQTVPRHRGKTPPGHHVHTHNRLGSAPW